MSFETAACEALSGLDIVLVPPSLPQAGQDGAIDIGALSPGEMIVVRIPNGQDFWHPTPGDTVWAYLDDLPSEIAVVVDSVDRLSWDAKFDPSKVPDGSYVATYKKTNLVGDVAPSLPIPVMIKGSTAQRYPGPIFPDAANGVLLYAKISGQNGASLDTQYLLQLGDEVTFYWQGFDIWGNEIPEAAYETSPSLKVGQRDVGNGYASDTIPLRCIQPLGNLGSGVAYYEVLREGVTHRSLPTRVEISWSDITALQVTSTVGAPLISPQLPNFNPCNCGTVFGEPGLDVTIYVSGGAIVEAGPSDPTTYRTRLNGAGLASFSVSSSNERTVAIIARSDAMVGKPPLATTTFDNYLDGSAAGIEGYIYTTYVPSDGVTACSIFFQVMPAFVNQTVTVTIVDENSRAMVVGAEKDTPHTRTIWLYDDGSGFAQIVDTCAEKVNVTLTVTGQPQSVQLPAPVEFISFPTASSAEAVQRPVSSIHGVVHE